MKNDLSYADPQHRFFLNPYEDCAFTRCPKCDTKTRLRKFNLAVHVEPNTFLVLGKTCRWCPYCDLIIGRKRELEPMMASACEKVNPDVIGNDYLFMGTVNREKYRECLVGTQNAKDVIPALHPFKDIWNFQSNRPTWSRIEYENDPEGGL